MPVKMGYVWLLAGAFGSVAACAQDTRVVAEPRIPRPCVVLFAEQTAGNINDVTPTESLDTARIQKAIDGCAPDHSVELAVTVSKKLSAPPLDAFVTGPLQLREGVTLLVDAHVTLFASRDPKVFDMDGGTPVPAWEAKMLNSAGTSGIKCGTAEPRPTTFPTFATGAGRPRGGCRSLITISGAKNAGIMGDGTIDGRGYAKLIGHDYSWWQMARKAEPKDDLYYSIRMISADHADGFTLYRIHLVNSPNFHVGVAQTNGFTAWGVHLQTPVDKSLIGTDNDARNTDGIDPGTSENVTVAHSWIDNGDDNIAIKQGVTHMSVIDNHFYSGHGMSIGSDTVLGQSYLLVDGLTEDHTSSGIRIKSNVKRGGPVHDLTYKNICMRDVKVPIAISPYYTNQTTEPFDDPKYEGDKIPDYKKIRLENIYAETPGDVLIAGLNEEHRTVVTLSNVFVRGIKPEQVHLRFADIAPNSVNFPLTGEKLRVTGTPTTPYPSPDPCEGKFVPMQ